MPFVPLSSDGVQRATTEALRAPRIQVALEPHEGGITVLAVEPTGLRPIGQFDPTAAGPYREVLGPLAEEGVYGICIAEASVTGTVLNLGPAETCLPEGSWPWRADGQADDPTTHEEPEPVPSTAARSGRLRDEDDEPEAPPAPVAAVAPGSDAATVVLDPGEAGRRSHAARGRRVIRAVSGAGPARLVLAGITALLLVGATAQGLTAAPPFDGTAVTAAPDPFLRPDGAPGPVPATVSVVPGAQVGAEVPAAGPDEPDAPAAAEPPAPAPRDEPQDEHDGSDDAEDGAGDPHDDPDSGHSDDGDSDSSEDGSDSGSDSGSDDGDSGSGDSDGGSDGSDDEPDDDRPGDGGGGGGGTYRTCLAAWADGKPFIRRGEPGYSRRLDLDGDGRACERR